MAAYYNEVDGYAAAWLRELIRRRLIAPGHVDERSIAEVTPHDLRGFTQCHFFAGIGVWSYALRAAGWADATSVWTGSCPCQPFSASGVRQGFSDSRHLWPAWHRLIRECRPNVVFGEQVADKNGLAWFDVVSADLERTRYAVGAADLCAAGVGAPQIRQRLYFVADTTSERCGEARRERRDGPAQRTRGGEARSVGNTVRERRQARRIGRSAEQSVAPMPTSGFWRTVEWLTCSDGTARPIEPGTFPLAASTPSRVVQLRGFGNALCAEVAIAFIEAYREVRAA